MEARAPIPEAFFFKALECGEPFLEPRMHVNGRE